ncbi:arginine-hydroxylase NDUFAF5, mitochondrial [Coccinella septempunctata]|uniref:arginine-hydroxylase NDUFAF5, mitochondrial n=1 Tax=Coccinella septempunctata TaxID=41139 RepID=UPI001D06E05D|nr:arginine-hydroxylase NDUFAF5, mitochondrial [Coccinella septempunctata]
MSLKRIISPKPIIRHLFGIRSISSSTQHFRIANESNAVYIFDRYTKSLQRERASSAQDVNLYDYLKDEVGYRIADRVFDIKRKFTLAADIGCGRGYVSKHLSKESVDQLILCDVSELNLESAAASVEKEIMVQKKILDEENIEFEPNSLDLVVSSLALHWVNDLPRAFKQILNALKEDGVFLASVFGGDTLYELRSSLQLAEQERQGGISPHISPFTEVRDIGSLLTNAGFSMLTIDTDEIIVNYPSMFELMWDLKGMAESNAAFNRSIHLNRNVQLASAAIYKELYRKDDKESGNFVVPATFQVINMLGWKPHSSQPKPMQRGTANTSLKDLYKLDEIIKEVKTVKDDDKK